MSTAERLRSFISQNSPKRGPNCQTCALPKDVWAAIEDGRTNGATYSTLANFLKSEGHKITGSQLGNHFRNHVQPAR